MHRRRNIPEHVSAKLDKFEQEVTKATERLARTEQAITDARTRLGGGFERDSEYKDWRATLDRLLPEQPKLQDELEDARYTLSECQHWLQELPDDVTLQPVPSRPTNGADLDGVRAHIKKAEEEIAALRAVPVPPPDIAERVKAYVQSLARPRIVSGLADGQALKVVWPDDPIAILALLLPNEMTNALLKEVDRITNASMPPAARKQRIAKLESEVDGLQRQALTLGENTLALPPDVLLGVEVVRREQRERVA